MKIISALVVSGVLFAMSVAAYAADTHYTIFVDAGSSGSRLHIFQYENTTALLPVVNDVFSESVKPGLSSFADTPTLAGASLKTLFDDAAQFLQKNGANPSTVSLNVFATAGMRLLPENKQQAIYQNVENYVKTHYAFTPGEMKTISGTWEGIYGWLDVNYLAENFQHQQPTVGSIDMGGASTQIVFATQDRSHPADEVTLRINQRDYIIFSKSFLGLGQDQALAALNTNSSANLCYPHQYSLTSSSVGDFDFANCGTMYSNIIQKADVASQIISTAGQSFVAYSGVYYAYHDFLQMDANVKHTDIDARIQQVCEEPWAQLQKEYSSIPEKYLSTYCANSVYIDHLLYDTYQLQEGQLTVATQINQKAIDWTLGAALYSLLPHALTQ